MNTPLAVFYQNYIASNSTHINTVDDLESRAINLLEDVRTLREKLEELLLEVYTQRMRLQTRCEAAKESVKWYHIWKSDNNVCAHLDNASMALADLIGVTVFESEKVQGATKAYGALRVDLYHTRY